MSSSPDETRPGFLKERVASRRAGLTATEIRVADYLVEHLDEAAFATAAAIGRAVGTTDASVVRTIKALGYPGVRELRRLIQQSLRLQMTPMSRLSHSLDELGSDPEVLLSRTLDGHMQLLEAARQTIDPAAFHTAVDILTTARETVVYGLGPLGHLGEYFALRMSRLRRPTRAATASGFLLADSLLELRDADAVVLIAHSSVAPETAAVLAHCARVSARTILITDVLSEVLGDRVTTSLTTPIGPIGTYSAQPVTLAVLEALVLAVAAQDRDRATEAMTALYELREDVNGNVSTAAALSRTSPPRRTKR